MRRTFRQLATVKPGRYLEAGAPTGLTGLFTHPSPRSTLLFTYANTLDKLAQFPESSLYRQSVEALTKHRLAIVEAVEPAGLAEWQKRSKEVIDANPGIFSQDGPVGGRMTGKYTSVKSGGQEWIVVKPEKVFDDEREEWDGEKDEGPMPAFRSKKDVILGEQRKLLNLYKEELEAVKRRNQGVELTKEQHAEIEKKVEARLNERPRSSAPPNDIELEKEPQLTSEQIEEVENKIGAGLIEEVIEVAEGELKLTETLLEAKVWEDLEEKPVEGQWTYFMRDSGTPTTQQPPQK